MTPVALNAPFAESQGFRRLWYHRAVMSNWNADRVKSTIVAAEIARLGLTHWKYGFGESFRIDGIATDRWGDRTLNLTGGRTVYIGWADKDELKLNGIDPKFVNSEVKRLREECKTKELADKEAAKALYAAKKRAKPVLRIVHRGTCYACGFKAAVGLDGRMSHHGFKIDGRFAGYGGTRKGGCLGTDLLPWEKSKVVGEKVLGTIVRYLNASKERQALVYSGLISVRSDHGQWKNIGVVREWVLDMVAPGEPTYPYHQARALDQIEREIERAEKDAERVRKDLAEWAPGELEIEEIR